MGVLGGGGFKGLITRNSKKTPNFDVEKSQSKIKIWSLLERETDSYVTGI